MPPNATPLMVEFDNLSLAMLPANIVFVTVAVSPVVTTVPVAAGNVMVLVPAVAVACTVIVPLVLPDSLRVVPAVGSSMPVPLITRAFTLFEAVAPTGVTVSVIELPCAVVV